jgi:hypothetical protein
LWQDPSIMQLSEGIIREAFRGIPASIFHQSICMFDNCANFLGNQLLD